LLICFLGLLIEAVKSRASDDEATLKVDPRTTLVFRLCVKCKKNPKFKGSAADHNLDEMYIDHKGWIVVVDPLLETINTESNAVELSHVAQSSVL
jgi:hypothetical protein